ISNNDTAKTASTGIIGTQETIIKAVQINGNFKTGIRQDAEGSITRDCMVANCVDGMVSDTPAGQEIANNVFRDNSNYGLSWIGNTPGSNYLHKNIFARNGRAGMGISAGGTSDLRPPVLKHNTFQGNPICI